MADNLAHSYNRRRVLTIDDLPDDDLLAIFDFYVVRYQYPDFREFSDDEIKWEIESWQSLVHVCRRWRGLVFASSRHLNLQLCCIPRTSATESLDVWPALPLLIKGSVNLLTEDDVIDVLKHSDRVRQINLHCDPSSSGFFKAMQIPFPELAVLRLTRYYFGPVLPDSFLGGSTPRLRFLELVLIPFPGLPKLLLSATHLVDLRLHEIPRFGYISPEAMVTCLPMLTSLESFQLEFHSHPDEEIRPSPPPTRSILPALTSFLFKGANKYLEDLMSRIDTPRLYQLSTTFFNDIGFNTPELYQFISRTPTVGPYNHNPALLIFRRHEALVTLQSYPEPSDHGMIEVKTFCPFAAPDERLSSLARICASSLRLLLTTENLYIFEDRHTSLEWPDYVESTKWLDLLLPFTAVKNLYVSKQLSPSIAPALQELTGERTTEVLPALQDVILEGFRPSEPVQKGIEQFISARQLINRPVAIRYGKETQSRGC